MVHKRKRGKLEKIMVLVSLVNHAAMIIKKNKTMLRLPNTIVFSRLKIIF